MSPSYQTAVQRMFALGHELAQTPSHKFDLAHMRVLLTALEHPERRFPSVLIAGTNGKGSTAATLASILQASGLRTGLYTSPHLMRINERIQINGEAIPDDKFALLHDMVERTAERLVEDGELPWHPSFFEMLTAIAFEHFATSKVEIAVLEVGMGGRLDATNVVEPRVSVLTDVALDHQKFLGNTITEIAREKVGIIRPGGVVVTLPQTPEANDVIGDAILELGATAVNAVPYVPPLSPASPRYSGSNTEDESSSALDEGSSTALAAERRKNTAHGASHGLGQSDGPAPKGRKTLVAGYPLEVMGRQILVETSLLGRHQLRNIALAIASAEELAKQGCPVTAKSIESGIRGTRWPGRFQVIPATDDAPEVVLDVAHNPAGAWALRSGLSSYYEDRRIIFVFGAMRDKAIAEMCEILFPLSELVVATCAENPRSATPEEVRNAAARTHTEIDIRPDIPSALARARELAREDGIMVVTGSIYVVGEAMRALGVSVDGK
jgi:dihydrofolate synthase / folylpolyglutamate synthase